MTTPPAAGSGQAMPVRVVEAIEDVCTQWRAYGAGQKATADAAKHALVAAIERERDAHAAEVRRCNHIISEQHNRLTAAERERDALQVRVAHQSSGYEEFEAWFTADKLDLDPTGKHWHVHETINAINGHVADLTAECDALREALARCLPLDDEGKRLRDAALAPRPPVKEG